MSIIQYRKAMTIIEANKELLDDLGGVNIDVISKAEKKLSVQFPKEYCEFLSKFGTMTFGATEIYGLLNDCHENQGAPDVVWVTLEERKVVSLPSHLVIIYDSGMGEKYCLDYRELNVDIEPKITSYFSGFSNEVQTFEVLYDSFGDFILDMVEDEVG